jgi:protein translocase SecG subunit
MVVYYLLATLYVFACMVLLIVILLQQGKGDMAAAFGAAVGRPSVPARARPC